MSLSEDQLRHCHKVLSSDAKECEILMEGGPPARVERLKARIDDDLKVMAVIELDLGYRPEYVVVSG